MPLAFWRLTDGGARRDRLYRTSQDWHDGRMAQTLEFQQRHLDRVSRSFAFCIRSLAQPLGRWVGLTYLICRILDTIEDATWATADGQNRAFDLFEAALNNGHAVLALAGWESQFVAVSIAEKGLLVDAHLVIRDFHELPLAIRVPVRDLVLSMSAGMRHFARRRQTSGRLKLVSLAEVNQYCFFVAGLVGEALSYMLSAVEPRFAPSKKSLLQAHHFGLFLQKVNILKDQRKDEDDGRLFVPSRQEVERSAQSNALEAMEFLCSVPVEQIEFRRFCGWSLFLGLETLVSARDSYWKRAYQRVPRLFTQNLLAKVNEMISDNQRLMELFFEKSARLNWNFQRSLDVPGNLPDWLSQLYRGRLDELSLANLGVIQ